MQPLEFKEEEDCQSQPTTNQRHFADLHLNLGWQCWSEASFEASKFQLH